MATSGRMFFYGAIGGYLKAVDARDEKDRFHRKTASGIIGNVMSFSHGGRRYVAVMSGIAGWTGIGPGAGLTDSHDGADPSAAFGRWSPVPRPAGI